MPGWIDQNTAAGTETPYSHPGPIAFWNGSAVQEYGEAEWCNALLSQGSVIAFFAKTRGVVPQCKVGATVFGRAPRDIEKLVEADNCSLMDFYAFFWKYMLDERASINLREEWNASRNG